MGKQKDKRRVMAEEFVISLVGCKLAPKWWNTPNKAFGGNTANEMWKRNRDIVLSFLSRSIH